jgi:hypothetical protein
MTLKQRAFEERRVSDVRHRYDSIARGEFDVAISKQDLRGIERGKSDLGFCSIFSPKKKSQSFQRQSNMIDSGETLFAPRDRKTGDPEEKQAVAPSNHPTR